MDREVLEDYPVATGTTEGPVRTDRREIPAGTVLLETMVLPEPWDKRAHKEPLVDLALLV